MWTKFLTGKSAVGLGLMVGLAVLLILIGWAIYRKLNPKVPKNEFDPSNITPGVFTNSSGVQGGFDAKAFAARGLDLLDGTFVPALDKIAWVSELNGKDDRTLAVIAQAFEQVLQEAAEAGTLLEWLIDEWSINDSEPTKNVIQRLRTLQRAR